MTQGEVPFPKERDIIRGELRFKTAVTVARHIRDFIRWLLNPDERARPTFQAILQHSWIKEGRERGNSTGLWKKIFARGREIDNSTLLG